ncbi:unnamed protein product [Owenia fusiformis]|uniref:Transcription initiation factor TFIID subunit 2 n=1 Tax=Owenia fusiformis TaxID=6347 RepID=A0A8J1YAE2_OWEFU|nr:unnamed protein product [Owenia fusiformis]
MKSKDPKIDLTRQYRLAHQTLCITGFNFNTKSYVGYTELTIHPLRQDLRRIKLNCKQCKIYRVSVNDKWEIPFLYNDPTLEAVQGEGKTRNLDTYMNAYNDAVCSVDASVGSGEITLRLPNEAFPIVAEMQPIRLILEFSLEEPSSGVQWVVPEGEGSLAENSAHMFTYRLENAARLCFPCIDSFAEPCTWKLEFTVDCDMIAVSCGDLVDTVYTQDMRKKTYHYYLSTPTSAFNIAFAVGPFEVLVDPNMHEVTHFCLPHLKPLLQHTTAFLHEAFEFYEELMSIRYPYSCYKQVFVDQTYDDAQSFATLTFLSSNLLHSSRIIDQTYLSRSIMAEAIARQFFGTFITMDTWSDAWLPKGISLYLASLFVKRFFGTNEYRYHIYEELQSVIDYEQNVCGIVLDPSSSLEHCTYFPIRHPHTISPRYAQMMEKKAHLVIRMLELRIGPELLTQVFNKLLSLATNASTQKTNYDLWGHMLLSTSSFLRGISTVTGKDVQVFIDQWVCQSGCPKFSGNFVFNRKRNVVELELKQDISSPGDLKYVGPLTMTIQELDGSFKHTFKIEENKTKFEITCHSKSRRQKKKKIPLMTGEEVDIDLSFMDADSPVLWLRPDGNMELLRKVVWEQPDFMWQYQLRHERDIIAQLEAINALEGYPTPATRMALTDCIENEQCFYRVRQSAAKCLAKVANAMSINWVGPPAMIQIFQKMFGSHANKNIVRLNNFTHFQQYYIQKSIPVAMASLRNVHNICPPEVVRLILDLVKYNDNGKNKFDDNYYKASLIDSLADTITPAVAMLALPGQGPSVNSLGSETRAIVEEVVRSLNLEKLLPCYGLVVSISCLKALRKLQKFGHLPSDISIFKAYTDKGIFKLLRLEAFKAVVDYVHVEESEKELQELLDVVEYDPDPHIRHSVVRFLIEKPPFARNKKHKLNTEYLVDRLWGLMNAKVSSDTRLRCDIADLYYTLYGRHRPVCLPIPENVMVLNLKKKTTQMNASLLEASEEELLEDLGGRYSPYRETSPVRSGIKRRASSPLSPVQRPPPPGESQSHQDDMSAFSFKDVNMDRAPLRLSSPDSSPLKSPPTGFASEYMKFAGVSEIMPPMFEQKSPPIPAGLPLVSPPIMTSNIDIQEEVIIMDDDSRSSFTESQRIKSEKSSQDSHHPDKHDSSSSKHHKKKKRKDKHKKHKKHKHKHDKHKLSDTDKKSENISSGTSTPVGTSQRLSPPSSPDFQVI